MKYISTLGAIIEAFTSCILAGIRATSMSCTRTKPEIERSYNVCEVHDIPSRNAEISCPWHAKSSRIVEFQFGRFDRWNKTILFWRQIMKYTSDFVSPWTWVCTNLKVELVHQICNPWGSKRGNIRISIIKVNVHDGVHEVSLQYGLHTFARARFKLIVTIFINTVWDGINSSKRCRWGTISVLIARSNILQMRCWS